MIQLDDLAAQIREQHQAVAATMTNAVTHARAAGQALLQAKAQVEHGQWLPWLEANCPEVADRTARLYMRVADHWPQIEGKVDGLPLRGVQGLLASPKRQRVADIPFVSEEEHKAEMADAIRSHGPGWNIRTSQKVALRMLVEIENRAELLESIVENHLAEIRPAEVRPDIFMRMAKAHRKAASLAMRAARAERPTAAVDADENELTERCREMLASISDENERQRWLYIWKAGRARYGPEWDGQGVVTKGKNWIFLDDALATEYGQCIGDNKLDAADDVLKRGTVVPIPKGHK